MKIGDPLDRSTDHGPQNHKAHLDKLLEYCEIGVKEGATLVYGGKQVGRPGATHILLAFLMDLIPEQTVGQMRLLLATVFVTRT